MSKSNNSGGPLTRFLKWGGPFFLEIEIKKGDRSRRGVGVRVPAVVAIPMAAKDC
jgi:hypothetical protein